MALRFLREEMEDNQKEDIFEKFLKTFLRKKTYFANFTVEKICSTGNLFGFCFLWF